MKHSRGRQEYGRLRDMGLLPSEARRVMQIPNYQNLEWVQQMLAEVSVKWKEASRRGTNREVYENGRVKSYIDRGWLRPGLTGQMIDPFCWIREHCDRYTKDHPEYTSPWTTRSRSLAREHRAIKNSAEYAPASWEERMEGAY